MKLQFMLRLSMWTGDFETFSIFLEFLPSTDYVTARLKHSHDMCKFLSTMNFPRIYSVNFE